jgi:CRP-like cAMP-binding protein
MNTSIEIVKRLLMLEHLPPDDAIALATFVTCKAYKRSQVITDGESRYLLTRGIVKSVMITDDGNPVFRRFYHKDQLFGSLFTPGLKGQLIIASDDATIFRLRGCDVLKYFQGKMILSSYHAHMEEYAHQTEEYCVDLMTKDVKERLVHFLEKLIRDYTREGTYTPITLDCSLSIEEIGRSIFATRQSVSFHLAELQQMGWVQKRKNTLWFATPTFDQFERFHKASVKAS